jgi:flagellar biosynthesis/type III secretory pathway chaperone
MMDELLEKLIGLITGEKQLYGSLLTVLQDEKAAVTGAGLEALNRSVKEKETVLLKIRILEEQRTNMLSQVAERLGLQAENLTLARLAREIPEPYAGQVRACRSSLLSLTQSIQELNNSNRHLFRRSLELVKGSINLLINLRAPYPIYCQSGRLESAMASGRVLSGNV